MISLYTLYSHLTSLAQHDHLPSLAQHDHLPSLAYHGHLPVATIIGLSSVPGILMTGWLSDQSSYQPLHLTTTIISISTIIPFILAWVENTWTIPIVTILFGFISGSWATTTTHVLISLLGLDHLGQSFGFLAAARSVAYLVFPSLTNHVLSLHISFMLSLISCCVYSAANWALQRKKSKAVVYLNI